jgi:hypothetical protein
LIAATGAVFEAGARAGEGDEVCPTDDGTDAMANAAQASHILTADT